MTGRLKFCSLLLLTLVLAAGCAGQKGHVPSADEILGEWQAAAGTDASDFYFSAGGDGLYYFNTSLSGRPYEAGNYSISGDQFRLFANQNNTYEGTALLIRGNELTYLLDGVQVKLVGSDRSRRCNPLFRYLRKRSGLVFGGPVTLDFTWLLPGGEQTEINGFEMTASVTVEGDFTAVNQQVKNLAAGLAELGFTPDQANLTEVMNGYRKDNVVCQIFLQETPDNLALIIARCGLLK